MKSGLLLGILGIAGGQFQLRADLVDVKLFSLRSRANVPVPNRLHPSMSEQDVDRSRRFWSLFAKMNSPKAAADEQLKTCSTHAQFRVGLLVHLANHDQCAADIVDRWRKRLKRRRRVNLVKEVPSSGHWVGVLRSSVYSVRTISRYTRLEI
jgi:hypothetical protein